MSLVHCYKPLAMLGTGEHSGPTLRIELGTYQTSHQFDSKEIPEPTGLLLNTKTTDAHTHTAQWSNT